MAEKILRVKDKNLVVMKRYDYPVCNVIFESTEKIIFIINKAHSIFWYQAYIYPDEVFADIKYHINSITVDFDVTCEKLSTADFAGCRAQIACEENNDLLRTVYRDESVITEQAPLSHHVSYRIDSSELGPMIYPENQNNVKSIGVSAGFETSSDTAEKYHLENFSLTVNYTAPQKVLTLNISPENSGRTEGAGSYDEGTYAEARAYGNDMWKFMSWNDGVTDNPRKILMDADKTFTAKFEKLMNVYVGNRKVKKIYKGTNEIKAVYIGNKKI